MTGAPFRIAKSIILQIFCSFDSESDPPKTVKSCANTYTSRPSIRPKPVTKPSPAGRWDSIPKSAQWWRTNLSSSSNVPSSSSTWMRSRAVNFPALCSRSRRSAPPPASASAVRRRNSSSRLSCGVRGARECSGSGKWLSSPHRVPYVENAHGQVRGYPYRSQKQDDAQSQLRPDGKRPFERRHDRRDPQRRGDQQKHCAERQRDDQDRGQNGGEDSLHEKSRRTALR